MSKKRLVLWLALVAVVCISQVGYCDQIKFVTQGGQSAHDFRPTHRAVFYFNKGIWLNQDVDWITETNAYKAMSNAQKEYIKWQKFYRTECEVKGRGVNDKILPVTRSGSQSRSSSRRPVSRTPSRTTSSRPEVSSVPTYWVRWELRAVSEDDAGKMVEAFLEEAVNEIEAKGVLLLEQKEKAKKEVKEYSGKVEKSSKAVAAGEKELEAFLKKTGYVNRVKCDNLIGQLKGKLYDLKVEKIGVMTRKEAIMRALEKLNAKIRSRPNSDDKYGSGLVVMKLKYEELAIDLEIELSDMEGGVEMAMRRLSNVEQYVEIAGRLEEARSTLKSYTRNQATAESQLKAAAEELEKNASVPMEIFDNEVTITQLN